MNTVRTFMSTLVKGGVVVVMIAAWFSISNHCALAVFENAKSAGATHRSCHGDSSSPARQPAKDGAPCCKILRATIAANANVPLAKAIGLERFVPVSVRAVVFQLDKEQRWTFLDTGPPSLSFAESVLQRSLLAHAPPLYLS